MPLPFLDSRRLPLPLRLASFYFAYFAYLGAFVAYFPLYLASRGLQAGEIAFVLALPPIARVFAPAVWGWIADRSGAQRGVVVFACFANAVCFALLPLTAEVAVLASLIALMSLLSAGAMPLVETITLGSLAGQSGAQLGKYGPIRLWGSIGFIAAVAAGGVALDRAPVAALPYALVALSVASLAVAAALPAGHAHAAPRAAPLQVTPAMRSLLAAGFCMAAAHGTLYAFLTLHLERVGYSATLIGALWTLGVLAEIVVFLFLPQLFRRHALSAILFAAFACAALRFLAIGWLPDELWILVLAQLLHAATFGAHHSASVAAVQRVFPQAAHGRGQALFSSLGYGAGGAAGALIAGLAWEAAGPGMAFSASAAMALIGAYFAYRLKRAGL
jgi:PPP family 3-phenylpropionic acid transporter